MFIVTTGMVSPVGSSAAAACAAQRAKISVFEELPYRDNRGEPIVGAVVPGVEAFPRRAPELVGLLAEALAGLLGSTPSKRWEDVPLLIGVAEPDRPDGVSDLPGSIVDRVQAALQVRFHRAHSRAFASGHTAAFEALAVARRLLEDGAVPACLVCGVDSLLGARTLLWLDRHFRLKTSANRDGVIPGEAAAAVLLQKQPPAGGGTEVAGLGFGHEKAHILSEEPLLGLGLAAAARAALADARVGLHEIDWRLSDATGELYGFKELSLVEGRLMRVVRKQAQPVWHWAETVGDTGAAAGVLQLVAVEEAFRKEYAPGGRVLCLTSAWEGARAAAVLWRGRAEGRGS
jgi:3-oxoacyl-[acyl-carrier-protein] synthase-1